MMEVISAAVTQDLKTEDILDLENQSCDFALAIKMSLEIQLYYKNTTHKNTTTVQICHLKRTLLNIFSVSYNFLGCKSIQCT